MKDITATNSRKFNFSLGTLLSAFPVVALLLVFGQRTYDWYYTIPSIPLSDAVASFNSQAMDDSVGQHEPRLTGAEIIASIMSQLPNLPANSGVKAIYSKIASTRQLPHDASLHSMSGWTLKDGSHFTVWWINLNVTTKGNSGFGLRIRENNKPVVKPPDEPELKRSNLTWIPESKIQE